MMPIVVYGLDEAADVAHIADRAQVPLTTTARELAAARAGQASVKNRLLTLEAPRDFGHLPAAVAESIGACVGLFTEKPPKGPRTNFGLAALRKWAGLLTDTKDPKGWARLFPPGPAMYAALKSTFEFIETAGTGGGAARPMYADFLDEASDLLGKPALRDIAGQFRASGEHWSALARALLPESVPRLKETRELVLRAERLFREQGGDSLAERRRIAGRLSDLKAELAGDFSLTTSESAALRDDLRQRILAIHDLERAAVVDLKEAIG
jgi:hypothetical protein